MSRSKSKSKPGFGAGQDADRDAVSSALAMPWSYARAKLGMRLHPVQEAVLRDLSVEGSRVAFRCGNEVGKTSKVATAAILYHCEVLGGLVVSTAGVRRQVEHQLWPNLTLYQHLYPGWTFAGLSIKDPKGRERYLGFTAANEGTFQGFHNLDGPLLIVLDESAAIKDGLIMAAEERCNPTRFLLMGSPLDPKGVFYEACTSKAAFYKQHKLSQLQCTTEDGWWLRKEDMQRKIEKWGAEHPVVLSNVFAEFSLSVEGALLSLREFDACLEDGPPVQVGSKRHAFLDFAAGRDENVLAVSQGNRAWIDGAWKEKNTMAAVGEFVSRLNRLRREIGLQPHEVEGDADGMGIVFCHALAEAGWPILEFHGGAAPRYSNGEYANLISEIWTEGTSAIRRREWIIPRDEVLKAQLIGRKAGRNSKGLMNIEPKEKLRNSPDRADALLAVLSPLPTLTAKQVMGEGNGVPRGNKGDWPLDEQEAGSGGGGDQLPGTFFG